MRLVFRSSQLFSVAALATLAAAALPASASAATYAWPLQITQPITVTNLAMPAGSSLSFSCNYTRAGTFTTSVSPTVTIPVTLTSAGIGSYSGNITATLNAPSGQTSPPGSGDHLQCSINPVGNITFTPNMFAGGFSSMNLP